MSHMYEHPLFSKAGFKDTEMGDRFSDNFLFVVRLQMNVIFKDRQGAQSELR